MTIEKKIKEEAYTITQQESGITSRDVSLAENRDEWQELYRYQVPTGLSYVFHPGDPFSIYQEYLSDTVGQAFADDGGSFTDETGEANEATQNDITLLPAAEAIGDAYYWGYRLPYGRLRLKVGTAGVGTAVVFEYYNGSAWATIPGLTDGTSGLTAAAGTYNIDFTPPADWARTTINNHEAFYLRIRCSVASFTTQPLGDQAWINGSSFELANTDRLRIEVRDPNENTRYPILHQRRYVQVKEFQDREKLGRLDISEDLVAGQGWWVVIMVLPLRGIVDVSNGYFALACSRVREGLN